jgi:hypothetical protein
MIGGLLAALLLLPSDQQPPHDPFHGGGNSGQARTQRTADGGARIAWSGERNAWVGTGPSRPAGPAAVQIYSQALCSETNGDGLPHGACRGLYCPEGGDPWLWLGPDPATGAPVKRGIECRLANPATPTLAAPPPDLQREFATKLIHRPTLHLHPDPTATPAQVALVNGPVTATVAPYDPAAAELHVTVPVPATIRATPTTTVDWGDGTTTTGTGTLTHTYRHHGTVTVTAATTWQGAWWPDAAPGATTALTPITLSTTQPLEVHEARSSLVAG